MADPPQGPERVTLPTCVFCRKAAPEHDARTVNGVGLVYFCSGRTTTYTSSRLAVPRSLAVELAEALETARWWVNAARRERPSAQLALEKSDAALSKAKEAGLLGADDG